MNNKENFYKATQYIKREGIELLVNWLNDETDFFSAPASTNFHGNYEGGLLDHSLHVLQFGLHNFNYIVKQNPDLEYLRESVVICSLFHDLCKTNYYFNEQKWTKDEQGRWKEYPGYVVKDLFPLGHGEKSIYIINKFMKLTDAEALAIRWHMSFTEPSVIIPNNPHYYAFNQAINHPLVKIIMTADMLSTSIEEIKDLKNS
jgi:hypothetical protein